jgi:hypothetical protein
VCEPRSRGDNIVAGAAARLSGIIRLEKPDVDPSAFGDSATGMVTVAIILVVPLVSIVVAMAVVLTFVNRRRKERKETMEQGMMSPRSGSIAK